MLCVFLASVLHMQSWIILLQVMQGTDDEQLKLNKITASLIFIAMRHISGSQPPPWLPANQWMKLLFSTAVIECKCVVDSCSITQGVFRLTVAWHVYPSTPRVFTVIVLSVLFFHSLVVQCVLPPPAPSLTFLLSWHSWSVCSGMY